MKNYIEIVFRNGHRKNITLNLKTEDCYDEFAEVLLVIKKSMRDNTDAVVTLIDVDDRVHLIRVSEVIDMSFNTPESIA